MTGTTGSTTGSRVRDPIIGDLKTTLRALKLGKMLDTLPERLALAQQRQLGHADYGALILGPVGTGKTHLATALGHIVVRRRYTTVVARADELFKRLKVARLDNSVETEMRRLAHVQLLIIDDFALKGLGQIETADFYELVVERHRKAATVMTSNREPGEWLAMMADPLLAQSAVDRLVSAAHVLIVERSLSWPTLIKVHSRSSGLS
ncbi:ATP-binding protein [Nonomuraea zeae]|uniref:Cell division protein ZapE n=1 Tax=Nonomuraea zeae TaxID=1642303 RepID=A0A5S4G903_9ACTN|nr:ATP-binding protein [Nonomuraea zeae]TMR29423.1 cell division protein ZapE [Nonomuraea zeae]